MAYEKAGVSYQWEPVSTCDYFQKLILTATLVVAVSPLLLGAGVVVGLVLGAERVGTWLGKRSPWKPWHESVEARDARWDREAKERIDRRAKKSKRLNDKDAKRKSLIQAYRDGKGHKFCERIEYSN